LRASAGDIIDAARPACIIELGSGMSRKTRHLLDACAKRGRLPSYTPIDVCDEVLLASGEALRATYPGLEVQAMVGDYTAGLGNLPRREARNLVVFLGGTIGNFLPAAALDFLRDLRAYM